MPDPRHKADAADRPDRPGHRVSRRVLLGELGVGSLLLTVGSSEPFALTGDAARATGDTSFMTMLRRPHDQLRLEVRAKDLILVRDSPSSYLRVDSTRALLNFVFEPQAKAEKAYDTTAPPLPGQASARMAKGSRVVFSIPDDVTRLYLGALPAGTISTGWISIWDWSRLNLATVPAAQVQTTAFPLTAPTGWQTALELPTFLVLSPPTLSRFHTHRGPRTFNGRTEAFSARLSKGAPVRAIWSLDPGLPSWLNELAADPSSNPDTPENLFRMAMDAQQRLELIRNSATTRYQIPGTTVEPIPVDRLTLTSVGGSLEVTKSWANPASGNLTHWSHVMTQGRDHYVKILRKGFLAPWGIPATLFILTQRRFDEASRQAYLEQRKFIVVRRPDVDLDHRDLPFRSVRLMMSVSPQLADPQSGLIGENAGIVSQPIDVDGNVVQWPFEAVDHAGNVTTFQMPLWWMAASSMIDPTIRQNAVAAFAKRVAMGGQRISYTPTRDGKPDASTYTTSEIVVRMHEADQIDGSTNTFNFHPYVREMDLQLDGPISGYADNPNAPSSAAVATSFRYLDEYVANGFASAEVWAKAVAPQPVTMPEDARPAVMNFAMGVTGLSRYTGVYGGLLDTPEQVGATSFDPGEWLDGALTLFGNVSLLDVLLPSTSLGDPSGTVPAGVPQISTKRTGEVIESRLEWHPELDETAIDAGGVSVQFPLVNNARQRAHIVATSRVDVSGGAPRTTVRGDLGPAKIAVGDLVQLTITKSTFSTEGGGKAALDLDIDPDSVVFGGALEFVDRLADVLDFGGPSGPRIEILPTRAIVSVAAPIPDIRLGVFVLSDLSFSAGVEIPFFGDEVTVSFALGTQARPFHLAIYGLGGGGYFELAVGASTGIQRLLVGLEVGAYIEIDFGIVSAGIECAFGFSYLYLADNPDYLIAYFRMHGEIDVAIASASISLMVALEKRGPDLWGRATLEIEVTALFVFGTTVTVEWKRRFKSSENDPPFSELYTENEWATYAAAFAPLWDEAVA